MSIKPKFVTKGPAAAQELPKEEKARQLAQVAVSKFEEQYALLQTMKRDFADSFPEAHQALQQILQQEDAVRESIASAHSLVQQARVSVGPFACVPKWSAAGYDGEALIGVLRECENGAALLQEMIDAGVLKELVLDKDATAFFARNPQYGELVKPAWRDKKEKTAAVTDPKI